MEQFEFLNWETMLHTLPGLQRISGSLIEDTQTGEPREVLLRRFAVLEENITGMALAALRLNHVPQLVTPLVDALQKLDKVISSLYCEALSDDYENLIHKICAAQLNVATFASGIREVQELLGQEFTQDQQEDRSGAPSTELGLLANG